MEIWDTYWSHKKYEPILLNPPNILYGGTNTEPLASIGMSCFIDPIKKKFLNGFTILDYGCGAGILANFISERIFDFKYFGIEPKSSHGIERIELGKKYFKDNRVYLGFIDDDLNDILKQGVDAIVLISVFTHLKIDDIFTILDKLINIYNINIDCDIIFSCFISDENKVIDHQPNIWERFYGVSYIKETDLIKYCEKNNLKLSEHRTFIAQGGYEHKIFKMKKYDRLE